MKTIFKILKVFGISVILFACGNTKPDIEMVYVEGGTFQMGSNDGDKDEKPVHTVKVNSFYIGKYEVTQQQWVEIMGNNPSHFNKCGENCPVENVSWKEVQKFITKLNEKTGMNYRLPTEAEWEYAARGGNKSRGYKYSGSDNAGDVAWYNSNSGKETHSAGQKKPNELGIYDMSGNVWEWCNDWYDENYYSVSPLNNPQGAQGATTGTYRVLHGGSFYNADDYLCVAGRTMVSPGYWDGNFGFRLCKTKE